MVITRSQVWELQGSSKLLKQVLRQRSSMQTCFILKKHNAAVQQSTPSVLNAVVNGLMVNGLTVYRCITLYDHHTWWDHYYCHTI